MFRRRGPERMRRKHVAVGVALALGLAPLLWWAPARQSPDDTGSATSPVAETTRETVTEEADAAKAPAPAKAAADVSPGRPVAPAEPIEDPLLQLPLSPGAALQLLEWCAQLAQPDRLSQLEQEWRWLGEDAAALERSNYARARSTFIERCGPWTMDRASDRAAALKVELIKRAQRSADLADRLRALSSDSAAEEADAARLAEARRLLETALTAGRPELLREVGRALERSRMATPDQLGPYAGGGAATLFTLLACDLGMACAADSEIVQLNCAFRGRCGYADYETMAFDSWHGAREREVIQTHRAELLRRIRVGQIDGLFDPVPLPPKP